jgi:hypothetical protein
MARTEDIKIRLDLPDDPTGYVYSSAEVLPEITMYEGVVSLGFVARQRSGTLLSLNLTTAAAEKLRDKLVEAFPVEVERLQAIERAARTVTTIDRAQGEQEFEDALHALTLLLLRK